MKARILILCAAFVLCNAAIGDTTIDVSHHNAYGANIGWLDARGDITHGAVIGQLYCTGYIYSANCGWISLGNGPTNGYHYGNTGASDWGVNHDGEGNLTGYAYGANIGWINFEQNYGKPRVDLDTGNLGGYIWSANCGWISLSNMQACARTTTLAEGPDSDGDGIPDAWEYSKVGGLSVLSGSGHDEDGDGVSDAEEYIADTDPDSDGSLLEIITVNSVGNRTNEVTWSSESTRFYRIERNDCLTNTASWTDCGLGKIPSDGGLITTRAVVNTNSGSLFYRVKAMLPLTP